VLSSGVVAGQGKVSRNDRSATKVSDGSPSYGGRKVAPASKESSGSKRQVTTQRNASASEIQFSKPKTVTESGGFCVCCLLLNAVRVTHLLHALADWVFCYV